MPCSDMLPMFVVPDAGSQVALVSGLNSYTCDWLQRARQSGPRLNFFIVDELAVIRPLHGKTLGPVIRIAASLSLAHSLFATEWLFFFFFFFFFFFSFSFFCFFSAACLFL